MLEELAVGLVVNPEQVVVEAAQVQSGARQRHPLAVRAA
jgi:hypothetical protein